jgi:hypothetical protein
MKHYIKPETLVFDIKPANIICASQQGENEYPRSWDDEFAYIPSQSRDINYLT